MEKERLPHDAGYKSFFSNPEMVESLLRDFVPEEFVAELDFSTLERCAASYVTEDLRERHDDIVWRVGWKNGSWCYLVLLVEFQSTPDHWMALRLLSYTTLLLLDLVKSGQVRREDGLPPVFPLVLYHGSRTWHAPQEVASLFAPMPASLQRYRPAHQYFLLDEGRVAEAELARSAGLAGQLLRLERAATPEQVRDIVRELVERLRGPEYLALRRAFTVWLGRVVLRRSGMAEDVPEFQDLQEVDAMLEERAARWKEDYIRQGVLMGFREGEAQGEARGIKIGEAQGEARGIRIGEAQGIRIGEARGIGIGSRSVLLALLRTRFGSVTPEVERLLDAVSHDADCMARLTVAACGADTLDAFADALRREVQASLPPSRKT